MEAEKTYVGWIQEGRCVRSGEQADYFLVSPDRRSWALFTEDQTEPIVEPPSDCVRVPRDERPAAQKGRPKVKISWDSENERVAVWVGPNKAAIAWLKDKKFKFDPHSYTWKRGTQKIVPDNLVKYFEDQGCVVEHDLVLI